MMLDLSWHTHQINLWIALSKFQPTFSATLDQLGYECDVIEEKLYISDSEGESIIHPDVVLTTTTDNHSLVIDCKSEEVSSDQIRRYLELDGEEDQLVIQGLVDDIPADSLTSDIVLSSFSDLSEEDIPDEIALVHFNADPYSGLAIWNLEQNSFDNTEVFDTFPINVDPDEPLPTSHYPFDIYEADKEAMVASVFSSVFSLALKENTYSIEDVLNLAHPYWDKLGQSKQDELKERTEIVHLELLDAGLDQYLEKIAGTEGREWSRTSATIQAAHRATDYYVTQVVEELPQSRLDHHAWRADSAENDESQADDD